MGRRGGDRGQGSVELVALLPLVVTVVAGVAQLLAAGVGHELAAHAAENGAIALADGEDAAAAVRDALPGWADARVVVRVHGREVRVRLTPVTVFPGAGRVLATEARADAGPPAVRAPGEMPGDAAAAAAIAGAGSAAALGAVAAPTRDDPGRAGGPSR